MVLYLLALSGWLAAVGMWVWHQTHGTLVITFEPEAREGGDCENCSCGGSCR